MKRIVSKFAFVNAVVALFFMGLVIDFPVVDITDNLLVTVAEAGGPASPSGAARRTGRRTARRTSQRVTHRHVARGTRVYVLPSGCTTVVVGGVTYHNCGGVYYQAYYEGDQVVYVVVDQP
jgi:hypothetical protein